MGCGSGHVLPDFHVFQGVFMPRAPFFMGFSRYFICIFLVFRHQNTIGEQQCHSPERMSEDCRQNLMRLPIAGTDIKEGVPNLRLQAPCFQR
jgi:hypothetical protein